MSRCPRLREDVVIRPSAEIEGEYYIKDPVLDAYYESNILQFEILKRLDGTRSLAAIAQEVSKVFEVEISASDIEGYLQELERLQLLDQPGPDIQSEELRQEVGKLARSQLLKQGFSLEEKQDESAHRRRRPRERLLFGKALVALQQDNITVALRLFGAILDLNPLNARARVFRRVIQESLFRTRRRFGRGSQISNPLRFRVLNPDRFLTAIERRLGWLVFNRVFVTAVILGFLAAVYVSWVHGAELAQQMEGFGRERPVTFLLLAYSTLFPLLFLHELAHGFTCKHFGGSVKEIGFALILLIPGAFADVSDIYFFSRRHRILTISAGMLIDIIVWAATIALWRVTEPGTAPNTLCLAIVGVQGLQSLFNWIPVIKNDGYYMLSDLLRLPNLLDSARLYFRSVLLTLISGNSLVPEVEPRQRKIFLTYHVLGGAYRGFFLAFVVPVYLGGYLVDWLRGVGLVMVLAYLALLFYRYRSFWPALRDAIRIDPDRFFRPIRLTVLALAVLGPVAAIILIPWQSKLNAQVSVRAESRAQIRTKERGQIGRMLVAEGDWVQKDQAVADLEHRELQIEHKRWQAAIAVLDAQIRLVKAGTRDEKLDLVRKKVDRLTTEVVFAARRHKRLLEMSQRWVVSAREAEKAGRAMAARENEKAQAMAELRTAMAAARPETIVALEADRARLQAEVALVDERMRRTRIRSPIAGIVTTPRLDQLEGCHLNSGAMVCEVENIGQLEALLLVAAQDTKELQKGALAKVKVWGRPLATYRCQVHHIAEKPREEGGKKFFEARCRLPGDSVLRVGMTGKAEIFVGKRHLIDLLARPVKRALGVDLWSLW